MENSACSKEYSEPMGNNNTYQYISFFVLVDTRTYDLMWLPHPVESLDHHISSQHPHPSNELAVPKPKNRKGKWIPNFTETSQKTYLPFENASIISEVVLSTGLSGPETGL